MEIKWNYDEYGWWLMLPFYQKCLLIAGVYLIGCFFAYLHTRTILWECNETKWGEYHSVPKGTKRKYILKSWLSIFQMRNLGF